MNFLPSVNVVCDECRGRRYQEDTLAVKYKGKSINDVLEMPISVAYEFFSGIPKITQKLKALVDVGLGYVHLGQSAVIGVVRKRRKKIRLRRLQRDRPRSVMSPAVFDLNIAK